MKWLLASAVCFSAACAPVERSTDLPRDARASFILVDKSDRTLTLYDGRAVLKTYTDLQFGDAPSGHKRFEGDE